MKSMLLEVVGLSLILKILKASRRDEDFDSPDESASQAVIDDCTEILENYLGVDNAFSDETLKTIYKTTLLELLDTLLGTNFLQNLNDVEVKSVQLCVDNDEVILLHFGDKHAS